MSTPARRSRGHNVSLTVSKEEYDLIYETGALLGVSVSSWGRDLLVAEALRRRNQMLYNPRTTHTQPEGTTTP